MMRAAIFLILLAVAPLAAARSADGTLDVIQLPNAGRPAVTAPGGEIAVHLRHTADLMLVSGAERYALALNIESTTDTTLRATAVLPAAIAPGRYALEAASASGTDRSPGVVFVRAHPLEDYYAIAHLGTLGALSADARTQLAAAVNASDAAVAFVSGIDPELDPAAAVALADAVAIPLFVAPPARLDAQSAYARYFGSAPFAVQIGPDICFAFGMTPGAADHLPAGNRLYPQRRAARALRWSIGLTGHYAPFENMRAQWALFTDDPLDYLLASGAVDPADENHGIARVPWGSTTLVYTPAAGAAALRIIDVTEAGMKFRPLPAAAVPATP